MVRFFVFLLISGFLIFTPILYAQDNDECLMCHEDTELITERDGREVSLYVDPEKYGKSIHGEFDCITCHADLDGAELSGANLEGARYNDNTIWPIGFDPAASGAKQSR